MGQMAFRSMCNKDIKLRVYLIRLLIINLVLQLNGILLGQLGKLMFILIKMILWWINIQVDLKHKNLSISIKYRNKS